MIAMENYIREGDKILIAIAHDPLLKRFQHLGRHHNTTSDRISAGFATRSGGKKG